MHIKEKDISLFLDNSLGHKKRDKLKEHFSACKACRDKLEEWKMLYSSLNNIEVDNELTGLEGKIMYKIKTARKAVSQKRPLVTVPALMYFLLIVFTLNLFAEPMFNILNVSYKKYMAFMLEGGLEVMNRFKWKAIDIIAMLETMKLTGILACAILILSGIYFTIKSMKIAHKV